MGNGGGDFAQRAYDIMKAHPNYKKPIPEKGESQIEFACRAIADLISPPQEPNESYDLECVDIAKAIRISLVKDLKKIWLKHNTIAQ